MSLQKWVEFGWLRAHRSSRKEIAGLLSIVDRDLKDAREQAISDAAYLDACRIKRNEVEYDTAGAATDKDADELLEFTRSLREDVLGWLNTNHPELLKR